MRAREGFRDEGAAAPSSRGEQAAAWPARQARGPATIPRRADGRQAQLEVSEKKEQKKVTGRRCGSACLAEQGCHRRAAAVAAHRAANPKRNKHRIRAERAA